MVSAVAMQKSVEIDGVSVMLPPGLAPPPGLELLQGPKKTQKKNKIVAQPPGLEQAAAQRKEKASRDNACMSPMYITSHLSAAPTPLRAPECGFTVEVSSLPNHILSDAMLGASLEQALLDKFVTGFITKPGQQRGEAFITLTTMDAALKCAKHFHGRRWDASGITVSARLQSNKLCPPLTPPLPNFASSKQTKTFAQKAHKAAAEKESFALSAEAPEFIPGGVLQELVAPARKATSTIGSDASTEDGESASSSDEKECGAAQAA